MNSITKRWVRGSLLVTILMCLVAEAVFLYYSITNYYDGARRAMTTRTSTIITQLNASAAQTGESQGVLLRRMVEQFTEKDKFELMLVNAAGKPLVTSTGFAPDDSVAGEDYLEALASEKGEGHAVYRTAMLTNPFSEDVPLLVDDVRVARNGKDYTLLDNSGNAVRVAMPEETYIDILAITGGNPFASLVIVNGDIWELKSIWYNKEYHTWRDERN